MKKALIDKLIELLGHEYRVYEDIYKLSKEKTDIIIKGKVSELDNVIKLEQALAMQISRIDGQREELLRKLSAVVNLGEDDLNISGVRKHADQEQSGKLAEYQDKMVSLVNELKHINQLNAKLIQNSLEFIELSLNLISNADITSNNYGKKGDASGSSRKNLFDMKL